MPLWPAVVGNMAGAIVGIMFAGPIGAVLANGTGPAAQWYLEQIRREWVHRGDVVLSAAEQTGGVDREVLFERIIKDPELGSLMARVIAASGSTNLEEKLRGLGRTLGRAIANEDRVDEALCLASALNDMEAPHFRLLRLVQEPQQGTSPGESGERTIGWTRGNMEHVPGLEIVIDSILGVLIRHGLVREVRYAGMRITADGPRYAPSSLGELCLALVAVTVQGEAAG